MKNLILSCLILLSFPFYSSSQETECCGAEANTYKCFCESNLHFCGYRVRYNPYTNCSVVEYENCGGAATAKKKKKYCGVGFENVKIGTPVMFEVMGLNPLKYDIKLWGREVSTGQDIGPNLMRAFEQFVSFAPGTALPIFPLGEGSGPGDSIAKKIEKCPKCKFEIKGLDLNNVAPQLFNSATPNENSLNNFKEPLQVVLQECKGEKDDDAICSNTTELKPDITKIEKLITIIDLLIGLETLKATYNATSNEIRKKGADIQSLHNAMSEEDSICNFDFYVKSIKQNKIGLNDSVYTLTLIKEKILKQISSIEFVNVTQGEASGSALSVAYTAFLDYNKNLIKENEKVILKISEAITAIQLNDMKPYIRYIIPRVESSTDYLEFKVSIQPRKKEAASATSNSSSAEPTSSTAFQTTTDNKTTTITTTTPKAITRDILITTSNRTFDTIQKSSSAAAGDAAKKTDKAQPAALVATGGYLLDSVYKFIIPTYGGVHFAFGTGPLITGFANPGYDLRPDTVYAPGTGGGNSMAFAGNRLIRTTNKNTRHTVNVGISALAHISYRHKNFWYFGGVIGVGFASDLNASLLTGASIMWGRKVKIGLSGGYALSTLRTPKGLYTIGDSKGSESLEFLNKSQLNNTTDYDVSYRNNWFMSLTLTFGDFTTKKASNPQP